ncbi:MULTISPECIES: type II secretion system protein GspM [Xanthomonas]|uniref:Type II secretion system protein M n=4 Tax=Xanthomonas TaxID=338 RepID=A0AB34QMN8_XANCH|nr:MULTISPECIES: type II secretion system protein GspM [Xanthomonas]ATS20101.1 type II secretion system protein M [Xanthomonas phaseoli pv. phaseoli]ATS26749.1 type II secretion system protein M [Xanthomonas phaseoli pv. phaseoli]ATS29779.1 type II secretion system protein M [Xanthomonas phaseoli pv. phaseoli]ATS35011.1 type II secretion system protein M [Xanthomonas phaseoli pv. phaseoli]AZU11829.1 type II secretion system protein M [Xanthomonas phaseoli pv. phaseoli]
MKAAVQRGTHWWQARAPRERRMLGVMCAALAAFVGWYALYMPLRHWHDRAWARYADAAQLVLDASAQAASTGRAAAPGPAALAEIIASSARDAGVDITSQHRSAAGGVEVQIDAVSAATLFGWLERLRQAHGLVPTHLRVAREQGQLRVRCGFAESGP